MRRTVIIDDRVSNAFPPPDAYRLIHMTRFRVALVGLIVLTSSSFCKADDLSSVVADGAELKQVVSDCVFTEGPAADSAGNVYFTDQPNDRIVRIGIDGTIGDFMRPSGRSNGMYFSPDGKLIACADEKNEMWSIDVDAKTREVLFAHLDGEQLNGPNDVWVHPSGVMYFTDPYYQRPWWKHNKAPQSTQSVYRVDKDMTITRQDEAFVQPNGIIGDPRRNRLYVADIGDRKTYLYTIAADQTLTDRKLFCEEGSDGMTVDTAGNVYLTGGEGVTVFDVDGKRLGVIKVPKSWSANVCFGGKDRSTLFITSMDSVYTLAMKTAGL